MRPARTYIYGDLEQITRCARLLQKGRVKIVMFRLRRVMYNNYQFMFCLARSLKLSTDSATFPNFFLRIPTDIFVDFPLLNCLVLPFPPSHSRSRCVLFTYYSPVLTSPLSPLSSSPFLLEVRVLETVLNLRRPRERERCFCPTQSKQNEGMSLHVAE